MRLVEPGHAHLVHGSEALPEGVDDVGSRVHGADLPGVQGVHQVAENVI